MALSNFARLTNEEKTIWAMDFWKAARNNAFISKYMGTSQDSMIQRITELKKSEKGTRAVITLVADLIGDGIAGDRTAEGNEEAMASYDQVIRYDQLRMQTRSEGRMSEQASIVNFREQSRDKLAYALGDRIDQMAFLTLSGVAYSYTNTGAVRTGSDLPYLDFANDVTTPTSKRYLVWDGTNKNFTTNTANSTLTAADTPSWSMFVQAKAYLKSHYVRPVRTKDGVDLYNVFITPDAMAKLKQDADFLANLRYAGVRGEANELFKGTSTVIVDGFAITEHRHVYNTTGTATKWGSGNTVEGCRMLFCGAQALAFADIGAPEWVEKYFDFENQLGLSTGKMFGMLKPKFYSIYDKSVEDFGVLAVDVAQ